MNATHLTSMSQPKSILVGTDLKDLDFLLPVAIDQATMAGAMIWLLHVIPPEAYASIEAGAYPFVGREKEYRAAEAALAKVAQDLREKNIACAYEVRRWYPVDEIKGCIKEHEIDRLIVGTSSRGKLGKVLVGSVAEELIRSLEIPVCTVGPSFKPLARNRPRSIVLALSLRHHPEQALRFAVDLAAGSAAELTVLHIAEQDLGDEGLAAGAMSKIQELLRRIAPTQTKAHIRIRSGEPGEEIIAECSAQSPEYLVLGALPASPFGAKFRTGVAYRVIAEAPCPIFTLRSGAKTKQAGNYREFAKVKMGSSYPG
jgi:nucleotide-binding universal stress UspA family protein